MVVLITRGLAPNSLSRVLILSCHYLLSAEQSTTPPVNALPRAMYYSFKKTTYAFARFSELINLLYILFKISGTEKSHLALALKQEWAISIGPKYPFLIALPVHGSLAQSFGRNRLHE